MSPWRSLCALLLGSVLCGPALAAPGVVHSDDVGHQLLVDGEPLWVKGMNWGYMPIGENYTYDFWGHDDDFIVTALTEDMGLLEAMGVNVIPSSRYQTNNPCDDGIRTILSTGEIMTEMVMFAVGRITSPKNLNL